MAVKNDHQKVCPSVLPLQERVPACPHPSSNQVLFQRFGTLIFQLRFSTANICLQSILQPEHTLSTLFYLSLYNFNPNQILYWSSGPNSPSFGKACSVGNRHSIYSNLDFLKSKYFPHPKYPGSWVGFINASYMFCFIFVFTPHSRRFCCQIIFMTSKHIPNESTPKLTSFSCLSFPTVYNLCMSISHFEGGESGSKNSTSFPCLFFWPLVFKDTFSLKVCHLLKFRSYPPWPQPPMCKAVSPSVSPSPWALAISLTTCPHSCAATQPGQSQYEHFNICFSILAVFNMVNPLSWTGSFSMDKAWAGCETMTTKPHGLGNRTFLRSGHQPYWRVQKFHEGKQHEIMLKRGQTWTKKISTFVLILGDKKSLKAFEKGNALTKEISGKWIW